MDVQSHRIFRMIWIPAIITLAITLLRLTGELRQWAKPLFNSEAGGGGAIIGISWLAVIFAIYFAIRLHRAGSSPEKGGKAIGLALLSLAICLGGNMLTFIGISNASLVAWLPGIAVVGCGLYLMRMAWPAYWKLMMVYGLAARIPVIVVMFFAIRGDWGTHYDAPAPGFTFPSSMAEFIHTGLLPQLVAWVPYTVVFCGLFGVITATIMKRRRAPTPA
jgi:hypothetical protein